MMKRENTKSLRMKALKMSSLTTLAKFFQTLENQSKKKMSQKKTNKIHQRR